MDKLMKSLEHSKSKSCSWLSPRAAPCITRYTHTKHKPTLKSLLHNNIMKNTLSDKYNIIHVCFFFCRAPCYLKMSMSASAVHMTATVQLHAQTLWDPTHARVTIL